jgi:hypothetical protein
LFFGVKVNNKSLRWHLIRKNIDIKFEVRIKSITFAAEIPMYGFQSVGSVAQLDRATAF